MRISYRGSLVVLIKTTRTFAQPYKFVKIPLHLMSYMKSSTILKHISSMKHKRRNNSLTCPFFPILHINHFKIRLETKCQTVHCTHQKLTKTILSFPKHDLSTYSQTKFFYLITSSLPWQVSTL